MSNLRFDFNRIDNHWKPIFISTILSLLIAHPLYSQNDPIADFTADQTTGCPGLVVNFTDQSVNAEKWTWIFQGGSPSNANTQGPHQVTYDNPGTFDVVLEIDGQYGSNTKTKSDYIHILDCTPVADFKANKTTGVQGLVVTFTDKSAYAESWNWSFQGGSPSNANTQGPHQVTYHNIGTFDVVLEIDGPCGPDKETKSDYITVTDGSPVANFSVNPSSGYKPLTVTYTDQSTRATTWNWSFPGGSPTSAQTKGPHEVNYSSVGSYNATLVAANRYGQDTKVKNNVVTVNPSYDFGDAPSPYPTTSQQNGARHTIDETLYLGQGVDPETDGQPDSTATGDDTHGSDDEDGVEWLQELVPNDTTLIRITASAGGFLKAWIDFNRDGDWEDEEETICNTQVGKGSNELQVFVPDSAVEGLTYARFRFSDNTIPSFDGEVHGGEVEDMQVYVGSSLFYDYGDAPDDETYHYQTLLENNGARHSVSKYIYIFDVDDGFHILPASSFIPDLENDGNPSLDAKGDNDTDYDDERGIYFWQPLVPGDTSTVRTVCVGEGWLHGWFDWNQDGIFDHPDEHSVLYEMGPGGSLWGLYIRIVDVVVPKTALLGDTYARFRFSKHRFLPPLGRGGDGEVEDYKVTVSSNLYDYGDAPDSYGTLKPYGACHPIQDLYMLGSELDSEPNGIPSVGAAGDDDDHVDDEDGVVFSSLIPGESAEIHVTTTLLWGAYLYGWIDFNQDGDFEDTGESIIDRVYVDDSGTEAYNIDIPADAHLGYTYARFRFTIAPDTTSERLIGPSNPSRWPGEVEDYRVHIGEMLFDYGDAPYPFKTLLQDDGARHIIDPDVYLGSAVSADEDGQPDSLAVGDDDDGVTFEGAWIPGDTVIAYVTTSTKIPGNTLKANVTAYAKSYISIWIAYEGADDGVLGIATANLNTEVLPADSSGREKGDTDFFPIPIPLDAGPGSAYLRIRYSTQPIDSAHGIAIDGEVEDYQIIIEKPSDVGPDPGQIIPKTYSLMQNYPNPFNPETNIQYQLQYSGRVIITIHNTLGLCVKTLVNEVQPAGTYTVTWDGKDDTGTIMGSGIYFIRMEADDFIRTQKMVFLK